VNKREWDEQLNATNHQLMGKVLIFAACLCIR